MIYLGIDWASDKHDVCMLAEDGRILSEFQITHDIPGFQQMHQLVQPLEPVYVNIERSDGLLVEWMIAHGYHVHVTTANVVAHLRPRRSKDDRGDAYLLAHLLWVKDKEARPIARQSATAIHLKLLASNYDMFLQQQLQLAHRLIP